MNTAVHDPGTVPQFDSKVNLVRPALPSFEEMEDDLRSIVASGMVTKGRFLSDYEDALAAHLKVKHAIGVSSCTAGLMLAYKSLELTGDVVVPSFTFMATVSALVWAGLRPVFCDVDYETATIDPAAVEAAITPQTSAIVAMHCFGNPAEIDALQDIAGRRGLKLIFDAAHGFGSLYRGEPVGPQGDVHIFSTSPTKLLISGEGGVVATNDDELAKRIRIGREYGNRGDYNSAFAGMNARISEMNAVMGLYSLRYLEDAATRRNELADLYRRELGKIPGISFQTVHPGNRCSYKDYSITVEPEFGLSRDDLADGLGRHNVDTRKYYDPPVHRHEAYRQWGDEYTLPVTDLLAERSLSIPLWSKMDDEVALGICAAIRKVREEG